MAPIFNLILMVAVAALLLFVKLIVDMQKARRDAISAIDRLKETVARAKSLAAKTHDLSSHPQVEDFLEFLMKADKIEMSLTERKGELLEEEKKLGFYKRLDENQRTWMKISHTANLFSKLTESRMQLFELEFQTASMTD